MRKKILTKIAILFIIVGIGIFCFPYVSNFIYEKKVEEDIEDFITKITEDENNTLLDKLYKELQMRNDEIYTKKQQNLVDPFSYEQPQINLTEYGINDNIIGYINIPKIAIKLPILLGANSNNMKKGAVHLTETSYSIGGENTNSVIAAHRGWGKAVMFRHLDKVEKGDIIYIQNFREQLTYKVYEIKIINPDDVQELEIQEEKDLITLITCHPYRVNTHRYVVKASRVD